MSLFVSLTQKQPHNLHAFPERFYLQENHLKLFGTEGEFCQAMVKQNLINLGFQWSFPGGPHFVCDGPEKLVPQQHVAQPCERCGHRLGCQLVVMESLKGNIAAPHISHSGKLFSSR